VKLKVAAVVFAGLFASAGAVGAAQEYSLAGNWRVADGSAVIAIQPCDTDALCGFVAAAPAPAPGEKSAVGQKILLGMRRQGAIWAGPIFNIEDGKTYDGELSLSSPDRLEIKGCLSAGGICGGETWKREPDAPVAPPAPPTPPAQGNKR
jgi:uncharacterized protein (DUF2147 family)